FDRYKREKAERIVSELRLVEPDARRAREAKDGMRRGESFALATALARDLINAPANDLHPTDLARAATELGKEARIDVRGVDMAGAAAVLGIMHALPALKPTAEVHGLIAATENMPSGSAIRPGDVLRAMNGTTIEIGNTDAEGRLTLADGLCYANTNIQADEIIDMATLTGACVIALGQLCSGLMTNNQALANRLMRAAEAAGERLW